MWPNLWYICSFVEFAWSIQGWELYKISDTELECFQDTVFQEILRGILQSSLDNGLKKINIQLDLIFKTDSENKFRKLLDRC